MASNTNFLPSAFFSSVLALAAAMSLTGYANAQSAAAPSAATTKATGKKPSKAPAVKPVVIYVPAAADKEQLDASERVYYGVYDCEFNQTIHIAASSKYPAYVEVKHLKADYLMKPVVSSTGAVRLEDTAGETLMVQIANKSMLLNVKTGHRVVDDCISPKQRELIAAAQAAKAAGGEQPGNSMFAGGNPTAK